MSKHLPAYHHDEKASLVKQELTFTFLWRHASKTLLVQRDGITLEGKKDRTAEDVPKDEARALWIRCIKSGFVRA